MNASGYLGLFVLSLVESAAIPVPSEVFLPFAGFLVASGQAGLWQSVIVATLGNFAGSVILYWLGYFGGRWVLDRYGKYILIHRADIERGDKWFSRHGTKAVFWCRMLPVIRSFISLPAGINVMNFKKFSVYTLLGALPWNFALIYAGYKAGEHWDSLFPYFHYIDYVVLALIIVIVVRYFIKKRRHAHG